MKTHEQHLREIRERLTSDDEREFFDKAVERWNGPSEGAVRLANDRAFEGIMSMTIDDAVAQLRSELPRATAVGVLAAGGDSSTSFASTRSDE